MDISSKQKPIFDIVSGAVVPAAICAGVAFTADMGYGLAYEIFAMPSLVVPGTPQLAYGQAAAFMAFVAAALGGAIGISVTLCWHRRWRLGLSISLTATLATLGFTTHLWSDSNSRYGSDPSDNIVYAPLYSASIALTCLIIAVSCIVGCLFVFRVLTRTRRPPHAR